MVPVLAKQFINRHKDEFNRTILDNLMICMLIYLSASVFLIGSSTPLCDFFFNRGKVSPEALQNIILLTKLYGIAFFGVLLYLVMGMSLLASNKGKYYATVGVATQIAVLAINLLFCPHYGVFVFPVALGSVHFVAGGIMFSRIDYVDVRHTLGYLFRASLAVSGITAMFYAFNGLVPYDVPFVRLVAVGLMLVALLPASAWMLGFDVKTYLMKIMSKFHHSR